MTYCRWFLFICISSGPFLIRRNQIWFNLLHQGPECCIGDLMMWQVQDLQLGFCLNCSPLQFIPISESSLGYAFNADSEAPFQNAYHATMDPSDASSDASEFV